MSDTSTIHVPIEPETRKKFTAKAKQLGFDSAQAYLRVVIKAVVDGRRIDFNLDDWGEPSNEAAERLNKAAEDAKKGHGLSGPFKTAKDFMKDL
jgi:antitoxin component of RelBE/YafQ-DinJ toxin-antitoxin module